ncbi:hypothetical protein, partial [uncultured Mucilaginibacter sp.]|uniref:hypothetical protein n=1 Tax=uncultured Mucilaginibacter sp. TaxID=797541 RepID=UPI0026147A20
LYLNVYFERLKTSLLIITATIPPALRFNFGLPGNAPDAVFTGIKAARRNDLVYSGCVKNNSL